MMCPKYQKLSELERCKCIPLCEYAEIFTDDKVCNAAKSKSFNFGSVKEGETCGFYGSTGEQFSNCAEDLECMESEDGTPECVLKGKEGETCGFYGSTGETFADCATGLQCMSPADAQPGAPNKCVLRSKEGEHCGVWGSTGTTHPDCAEDLFCMLPEDGLLGAPSKCVPRSKKG